MLQSFFNRFRSKPVDNTLASAVTDDNITQGRRAFDDSLRHRTDYDRAQLLEKIINRYRGNPIAKRIIEITTEFVVGDGFAISSPNRTTEKYLKDFWKHELNDIATQLPEWADEAWRTGDLFLLVSVDKAGFSYVRAIPSENITQINTQNNDYRQELSYSKNAFDEDPYPAYNPNAEQDLFVLHFPLTRMVGSSFGESDLFSILYWIDLYTDFLENRARLNFFRQLFSFVLQKNFSSQAEKDNYVRDFAAKMPKKSGGILAMGIDEVLGVLNPQLGSFEAEQDGLAIKRMIATGVGLPLHYLAEPESSTRTTADAAGTPTFKRFKRRQQYLVHALVTLLQVVLDVRRKHGQTHLPSHPEIKIVTPDITERDNANLAMAVQRVTQAFIPLYNAKKITAKELIRLVYKFLAEQPPESIPDEDSPIYSKTTPAPAEPDPGALPIEPDSADPAQEQN